MLTLLSSYHELRLCLGHNLRRAVNADCYAYAYCLCATLRHTRSCSITWPLFFVVGLISYALHFPFIRRPSKRVESVVGASRRLLSMKRHRDDVVPQESRTSRIGASPKLVASAGSSPLSRSGSQLPPSPLTRYMLPPSAVVPVQFPLPSSSSSFAVPPTQPPPIAAPSLAAASSPPAPNPVVPATDTTHLAALLRRTDLSLMRDSQVASWLRDAPSWMPSAVSLCPEVRFLVLQVLCTIPWARYHRRPPRAADDEGPPSADDALEARASSNSSATVGKQVARTFVYLEKVCMLLIDLSPHLVRGVVAVIMKPLMSARVPSYLDPSGQSSARGPPYVPVETIARVLNHVAVRYPTMVPSPLLDECIEPLMPKRRWPVLEHHLACTDVLLRLALDATLPPLPDAHQVTGTVLCRPCDADDGALDSDAARSSAGASSSSRYDSDASVRTTPVATILSRTSPPNAPWAPETTNSLNPGDTASWQTGKSWLPPPVPLGSTNVADAMGQLAAASHDSEPFARNNKLLAHRNAVILLLLRQMLEMEITLTFEGEEGSRAVLAAAGEAPRGDDDGATVVSAVRRWEQAPKVAPSDGETLRILVACAEFVFARLAADLKTQREAGACGNASWWKDLLNFHVTSLLVPERPVVLHRLAPRIALLGSGLEAADIVHRTVSTVLKGLLVSSAGSGLSSTHLGKAGQGKAAPPRQVFAAPQLLPTDRRLRASKHIGPLVVLLRHVDESIATGVVRRLMKWLAVETTRGAGGAAAASHSLLETVFAQALYIAKVTQVSLAEDLPEEQVALLSASLRVDASVGDGEELIRAAQRGLLRPSLYGGNGTSSLSGDEESAEASARVTTSTKTE